MGKRVNQNNSESVAASRGPVAADSGTVLILHDGEMLVERLLQMFRAAKMAVEVFDTATQLLAARLPQGPTCLVTCASGGEKCGLRAYEALKTNGIYLPVVFLTHTADFRLAVEAMRAGAEDFVSLPFDEVELLASIIKALERSRRFLQNCAINLEFRQRANSLTDREREVVRLVVGGMLNKEIADHLNLALVTVKVHRGNAMRKLGARTGAELARIARNAGILSGTITTRPEVDGRGQTDLRADGD
jgi:FixJ family two-component response regulator